jgi:hypothetical protein
LFSEAAVRHVRAYHPPAHYKPPTMNDLPVPQGSWQSQYNSNQTKYTIHLIGGVTLLTFTVGFVSTCRPFCEGKDSDRKTGALQNTQGFRFGKYSLV